MTTNDKISDFITFPRTFEKYKWYKPILVIILSAIIMLVLAVIVVAVFYMIFGAEFVMTAFNGGYEILNSPEMIFFTDLLLIIFIPSLYLASKIVKDRPFSSYSSSRGGWNFKLYFTALVIPLILYIIFLAIDTMVNGASGESQFSLPFFIVILISIPLQCITEEYAFRGFLMQTLGSWIKMPVLAIIIQAVVFAMAHGYNTIGLIEVLTTGLICGFFAWKTNGIEVSSALHTANNLSLGLFVIFGLQSSSSTPNLISVVETVVFVIMLAAIMYYVGRKTDWFGEIPENV